MSTRRSSACSRRPGNSTAPRFAPTRWPKPVAHPKNHEESRMRGHSTVVLAVATLTAACGGERSPKPADAAPPPSADAAPPPAAPDIVEGFKHPESVKYDPGLNVWYVSNINGDPFAKDNNGFISRLKADGSVDSLEFIAGGKNGVTLNGPKGMALVGDTLWVADIDAVRGFDRRSGAPL